MSARSAFYQPSSRQAPDEADRHEARVLLTSLTDESAGPAGSERMTLGTSHRRCTMSVLSSHTLEAPGAVLSYDVRSDGSSAEPVLLLIGSPMTADGFAALAERFPERTVVTYDPRGAGRSPRTDGALETTPEEHADDLHRLIAALDAGPVDLFATSGGAVNALALVARHPEQVRTLVAHEPPIWHLLPDREIGLAAIVDIHETYLSHGFGPAMAKFIALVGFEGPFPADYLDRPAPDPAMFGLPVTDDGSRNDPLLGQNMISCNYFQPDIDALGHVPTRLVLGLGAASTSIITGRATLALAERLGTTPVVFPGGHAGFLEGEMSQGGGPDAFAATLRRVLVGEDSLVSAG
jgi:pimeloyl-ACP methyl ester carboxylesterase